MHKHIYAVSLLICVSTQITQAATIKPNRTPVCGFYTGEAMYWGVKVGAYSAIGYVTNSLLTSGKKNPVTISNNTIIATPEWQDYIDEGGAKGIATRGVQVGVNAVMAHGLMAAPVAGVAKAGTDLFTACATINAIPGVAVHGAIAGLSFPTACTPTAMANAGVTYSRAQTMATGAATGAAIAFTGGIGADNMAKITTAVKAVGTTATGWGTATIGASAAEGAGTAVGLHAAIETAAQAARLAGLAMWWLP